MASLGHVTKQADGSYTGQLKMISLRTPVDIVPNRNKETDDQPDYRILASGVEIGAGWDRVGEQSRNKYVSLAIAAPELGDRRIFCNLGRAAGQDDDDTFALIWNPAN